jgi:hypothetical protein
MVAQTAHNRFFAKTALLSSYQMPGVIHVAEVIRVLNKAKIRFVLVGAYGLAEWRKEARGTEDVDIVVAAKQIKKAVKVLTDAFPQLEPVDLPVVVRLRERSTENVLIDVMKPVQQPYLEVFKHTHPATTEGEKYCIPTLEMAIVMKFSAMTSLHRAVEDKYKDARDFVRMVKNNQDLDLEIIASLACLIYPEGGKDILDMVGKAQRDEVLPL